MLKRYYYVILIFKRSKLFKTVRNLTYLIRYAMAWRIVSIIKNGKIRAKGKKIVRYIARAACTIYTNSTDSPTSNTGQVFLVFKINTFWCFLNFFNKTVIFSITFRLVENFIRGCFRFKKLALSLFNRL